MQRSTGTTAWYLIASAIASGGLGHGDYLLARLFLPYAMLLTSQTDDVLAAPSIALAFVQFPIECGLIGCATASR